MPDQSYQDSLKRWKQKVADTKEREYDYDTVSGLSNDLLYLPDVDNQDLD